MAPLATSSTNSQLTSEKKLVKVLDVLGRKTNQVTNMPVLFIYDDGTVEKRFQIKR